MKFLDASREQEQTAESASFEGDAGQRLIRGAPAILMCSGQRLASHAGYRV